jgi:hypothetical protein
MFFAEPTRALRGNPLPPASDDIVEALLHRVPSGAPLTDMADWRAAKLFPCVSEDLVQAVERRLGFALPQLLRDVYTRVGNGGFGPAYGLIGIESFLAPSRFRLFLVLAGETASILLRRLRHIFLRSLLEPRRSRLCLRT